MTFSTFPSAASLSISAPQPPDPLQLSRDAQAIIGEEQRAAEVLRDLVSTYGSGEADR